MHLSILDLTKSINQLDYIAEKIAKKLNNIGIYQIVDLLFYFPINIVKRNFCQNINDIQIKESNVITLTVKKYLKTPKTTQIICIDNDNNQISIILFKTFKGYLEQYLGIDKKILIIATAEFYNGKIVFYHPEKILDPNQFKNIKAIEPVYKRHQDITSNKFQNYIKQALNIMLNCDILEWQDQDYLSANYLPSFKEAIFKIHNPKNLADISPSGKNITRLALDEIIHYHFTLISSRENIESSQGIKFSPNNSLIKPFMHQIPFNLTSDQINAIKTLKKDLQQETQSTTLLQGDVGSGKTIVCFIASLFALESKTQVAFMAPTEILAIQHYQNFVNFAQNLGITISLLKGKESAKNKKQIIENLQNGVIDILVGTHALIQDTVQFKNLGLVVIDEQHKFGVDQRLSLLNKGNNPHLILTTATPIPRTLSLALYGDIKSIEIKEKPQNRKEIITKTIPKNRLQDLITSIKRALANKEKIYWVCPLVEESEKIKLTSSKERFNWLTEIFPNEKLFLLHGKLKSKEKEEIINEFKNTLGAAILVSTTVIEVGVDIPECNIMIIENAESYGLAQLHQLRGRVGRGHSQGICILLYNNNISQTSKKRLSVIKSSNDGFFISEQDLAIRGFGDILGTMQSGFEYFKVVNLDFHSQYLLSCIQKAKMLVHKLENNQNIQNINHLKIIFSKYLENLNKFG